MVKEFKNIENLINYLNLTLDELNEIIERIKDYKEYFNYLIPKRNGSYRLISAPSNRLKKIQKKLLDSFNNIYNRKKYQKNIYYSFVCKIQKNIKKIAISLDFIAKLIYNRRG